MTENAPNPSVEVVEESKETLDVLRLKNTPRPEKLALEQRYHEGATEVEYRERAFVPHHKASLDEIRGAVDALRPVKRDLPDVPPAPTLEPAPPVRPPVPERYRKALAGAGEGKLVAVERVYEAATGEVVEATFEKDGKSLSRAFVLKDGKASPVDDVSSRIDALPAPRTRAPVAPPPAAKQPDEAPARKRRFGLGKKKDAPEAEPPTAAPPEAGPEADEAPPKRRFGLGRKK